MRHPTENKALGPVETKATPPGTVQVKVPGGNRPSS